MPLINNESVQVRDIESSHASKSMNSLSIKKNDSDGKFVKILKKIALKNKNLKTEQSRKEISLNHGKTDKVLAESDKNKKTLSIKFVRLENLVKENQLTAKADQEKNKNKITDEIKLDKHNIGTKDKENLINSLQTGFAEKKKSDKADDGKIKLDSEAAELKNKSVRVISSERLIQDTSNKAAIDITVVDLRQKAKQAKSVEKTPEVEGIKLKSSDIAGEDLKVSLFKAENNSADSPRESNSVNTKVFREMFNQYLKDKGNEDIVKKTKIILKNDNKGEIKLIIKPEKMGNVRIKLNLNDNRIAGRIIVENNMVKEVFENNMDMLNKALRAGGFESAGIDVFVGNNGASGRGFGENEEELAESNIFKIKTYDDLSSSADDKYNSDTLINLVI